MASEPAPAVRDGSSTGGISRSPCACGAVALAAYLRTLAPGLTADLDSPLFQFIGRALGVAHNPGYPLYTLLTWPIAQLPVGELAWRINVFSAVMGAVATGLVFLAARRLEARRIVSVAAALGFAAGATFWSQAVIAEVYTLHAALVAGLLVAALTWSRSRHPAHFYAALGCLAAGLGHHTTILAFAPGLALQALLVDRHFVLARPHPRDVRGDPGARPPAVRADPRAFARSAGLCRVARDDARRAGAGRARAAVPGSALRRRLARARVRSGAAALGAGLRRRPDLGRARVRGDRRRLAAAAAARRRAAHGQRRRRR